MNRGWAGSLSSKNSILNGNGLSFPAGQAWMTWLHRKVITISSLTIRATLNGTHLVASRELSNGPGPSFVNLPAPGCWTLDLSWAGHQDQVDLWYAAS